MPVGKVAEALDEAARQVLTRTPPRSTRARVRFLLGRCGGRTGVVAQRLGVDPRSVRRYLRGDRRNPPAAVTARLDAEVRRLWQPRVRRRARQRAADGGMVLLEARARFGFASSAGSTDDPRMRRITRHLSPDRARELFDAHDAGAREPELERILATALGEAYFLEGAPRPGGPATVEFVAVDYVLFDLGPGTRTPLTDIRVGS